MNIITVDITMTPTCHEHILLGKKGEYNTTTIQFDLTSLIETYGEGDAVVIYKNPDGTEYIEASTIDDDGILSWVINQVDTSVTGAGTVTLFWYVADGLAKTLQFPTYIMDAVVGSDDPPEYYETWLERLIELGEEVEANAEIAEASATSASESATSAEESATSAAASAESAETSELSAIASATSASDYATSASEYATSASESASASATVLESVTTMHTEISGWVTETQGYAESASASAESAEESATSASTSAENASASATSASASAESASETLTEVVSAGTSAVTNIENAESSALANISTAETSALSDISTAQTTAVTTITTAQTTATTTITNAQTTAVSAIESAETTALSNIEDAEESAIATIEAQGSSYDARITDLEGLVLHTTASASPIEDSASYYLKSLAVDGASSQPTTTGINLLPALADGTYDLGLGLTLTASGGTYHITGTTTGSGNTNILTLAHSYTYADTSYYLHMRNDGTGGNGAYTFAISLLNDDTVIQGATYLATTNRTVAVGNVGDGDTINAIRFYLLSIDVGTEFDLTLTPSIETTSSTTDFEEYTGGEPSPSPSFPQAITSVEEINITLSDDDGNSQTVTITPSEPLRAVGDVCDVLNLDGTITRYCGYDTATQTANSGGGIAYTPSASILSSADQLALLCTIAIPSKTSSNPSVYINVGRTGIIIANLSASTSYTFSVLYPLATPTTESLSESDIAALAALRTYATTTNVSITDQDGNDCTWVLGYVQDINTVISSLVNAVSALS